MPEKIEDKTVTVDISNSDSQGRLRLDFSQRVRLPANYTLWTSENEGRERLEIKYLPNEETIESVIDENRDLSYKWSVKYDLDAGDASSTKRNLAQVNRTGVTDTDKLEIQMEYY